MLLEQQGGMLGVRYFAHPVGVHLFVVEKLEEGIIGVPPLLMGQEGNALVIVADDQVTLEASIELPSGGYQSLCYLFPAQSFYPPLSRTPG